MSKRVFAALFLALSILLFKADFAWAQTAAPAFSEEVEFESTSGALLASPTPIATPEPVMPKLDLTQNTEESVGPLEKILASQTLGTLRITNIFKYAIRNAIDAGVPANTVVLLLLMPLVAFVIAAARHIVGLRGFGIFLPASLAVVFLAIGPVVGIGLFLVIVIVSTLSRVTLRKLRLKLQYLPRMALILWLVILSVLGVLFASPVLRLPGLINVSIFPVLILTLLAEDFTKIQLGKSINTAINLTVETLILALISFIFLTLEPLQEFALLNPEILLGAVAVLDYIVGKYVGLRFVEYWRFRKLITS